MQREIVQITCDGCGKRAEMTDADTLPPNWKEFILAEYEVSSDLHFDVCSSGCAENAAIKIIRGQYDLPPM